MKDLKNISKRYPKEKRRLAGETVTEKEGTKLKVTKGKNPKAFDVEPAYAFVTMGVTLNMGEYESFRMDIGMTVPCLPEELNKTVNATHDRVKSELEKRVREATGRKLGR